MSLALLLTAVSLGPFRDPNTFTTWDLTSLKFGAERTVASREFVWDTLQAASALEGLVNRKSPKLYLYFVGGDADLDRYWLKRLRSTWLKSAVRDEIYSVDEAVARFRGAIRGIVAWDERVPATSNVAATISGVENVLPIRFDLTEGSLYRHLAIDADGPRLPVRIRLLADDGGPLFTGKGIIPGTKLATTGSAKCDAYVWAAENYLKTGKCGGGWMSYYPDSTWLTTPHGVPLERTLLTNHDFFIAKKAFFFDLSPWEDETPDDDRNQPLGADAATLKQILLSEYRMNEGRFTHVGGFTPWDQKYTDYTGQKHGGVETEWHYAEVLTCFNAFMDADAPGLHAMANASIFMHEPLKRKYPQPNLPTDAALRQKGYLATDGTVIAKPYVSIYVGDYDSAAWLYSTMPRIWDDPARGSIPLGWAFNPVLDARFPTGLVYARQTATPNDFFVSGDSGAGYLNPGYLDEPRKWSGLPSGLDAWAAFNKELFSRWDLGIVGFVIDGNAPPMSEATKIAYTRFARAGVVAQKTPHLSLTNATPFLQMGSDLPHDNIEAAAKIVCGDAPETGLGFNIYRTILWTPTEHVTLFKRIKELRPDIAIVDPYTLMRLAKLSLQPNSK